MTRQHRIVVVMLTAAAAMISPALADVLYYAEGVGQPLDRWRIVRSLSDGSLQQVVVSQFESIQSIALDVHDRKMYWLSQDGLRRADLNGSNVEHIVPEAHGLDLEIDVSGGKVYWRGNTIERANLDGSNVQEIVDPPATAAGGIAVHGPSGKIYWADNNYPLDDEIPHQIYRANLNGTGVELILERDDWLKLVNLESNPDHSGSKLYWFQWTVLGPNTTGIARSELDGSAYEYIDVEASFENPPLVVTDTQIYWTIISCGDVCDPSKIFRADLDGNAEEFLFQAGGSITTMDVDETSNSIDVPATSGPVAGLLAVLLVLLTSALVVRSRAGRRRDLS